MKRKYKRLEKYLKKQGYDNSGVSDFPCGILQMTYTFKKFNYKMINENYKIHILFTQDDNFSITLEIINHPTIDTGLNEYDEEVLYIGYTNHFMQLYKGKCPNYLIAKSIIYYTCSRYITDNKTLIDDSNEFDVTPTEEDLPFMKDRLSINDFEMAIRELLQSNNVYTENVYVDESSTLLH